MNEQRDDGLTSRIRDALEAGTQGLDADSVQRLRAARQAAVAVVESRASRQVGAGWWMPAGAFATAVFAVVALSLWQGRLGDVASKNDVTLAAVEDIEVLAGGDDAAIAEDVEFYQWLDLIDEAG